jgi:hypothetical protein
MKTLVITVAALVVIYAGVQLFYWGPTWKTITDRCIDYNPQWLGVLDCYGVISIWQPDNSGYLIENNKQAGPIMAQIKSVDAFTIKGDEMYFIDITPKGICDNLVPEKYCGDFQVDGDSKTYYYDSPEQVPTLIMTNIKTGDQQFYVKPADAPTNERAIFEELLSR